MLIQRVPCIAITGVVLTGDGDGLLVECSESTYELSRCAFSQFYR